MRLLLRVERLLKSILPAKVTNIIRGLLGWDKTEYINVNIKELLIHHEKTNKRKLIGIIIKLLAVEDYYGKNNMGFDLYKKYLVAHSSLNKALECIDKFKKLIDSFEKNAYDMTSEIHCDKNMHLLDGDHRTALCMYHHIGVVPCRVFINKKGYAYKGDWYKDNGFTVGEMDIIWAKYNEIKNAAT